MKPNFRLCELCHRPANLYCTSDNAFLCFHCDFTVHNANFLVARHLRRFICSSCHSLTEDFFSGHRFPSLTSSLCRSCSPEDDSSSASTVSSACVSTTETDRRRRKPARLRSREVKSGEVEVIFGNWCRKLGLNGNYVIPRASDAMEICVGKYGKVLAYRVCLAASFWFGLKYSGNATRQNLRGVENASGVPGKLIVAVELKIEEVLRVRSSRHDLEEGWAECSV